MEEIALNKKKAPLNQKKRYSICPINRIRLLKNP